MEIKPLEKHIQKIEKERKKIFLESLYFSEKIDNNFQNYYFLVIIISGIILSFNFFKNGHSSIYWLNIALILGIFVFNLAKYLNFIENKSEKYKNIFSSLDLKNKQELSIIKGFYSGKFDEKELRDFYLENKDFFERHSLFNKNKNAIERWVIFVCLSLASVFSFF